MIKLSTWDRLYCHTIDWALRRMDDEDLKLYKDKKEDWVNALLAFQKIKEELFLDFAVTYKSGNKFKRTCVKGLELTPNELFNLFHKHLNKYTNHTVRYFIFHWWTELRHYIPEAQPHLDCPWEHYKPATKEEIEQARIDFGSVEDKDLYTNEIYYHNHTFRDDARVLEYRGERFIIDNEWNCAWAKGKDGKVRSFSLEWDWWYPIDEFLDLDNI